MSDPQSPWTQPPKRPPPPQPTNRRLRTALWIGLIALMLLLGFGLNRLYPDVASTSQDPGGWMRWVLMGTIVAAGLVRLRLKPVEAVRNIAVWVAIVGVVALGYSFRNELGSAFGHVRAEFAPGYPVSTGSHEMVVTQDQDGGFYVIGQVNGQPVRFLADTGASDIVLSPRDAQRLGVDLGALKFGRPSQTANGVGYGASYRADSLSVGQVHLTDVPMEINQAPMPSSLLGMTFFKRLESFQIKDGKLYLRWQG